LAIGWLCVGVGGLGVIVPGLPTTVFFIGAASCFARSSPRFERWVLGLPHIGPLVRDYRAGRGMRRRAKALAAGTIVVVCGLSISAVDDWAVRLVIGAAGLVGVWYVGWRVPTRERLGPARLRPQ
jgi:uncharacterized protein